MDDDRLTDAANKLVNLSFEEAEEIISRLGHYTKCTTCERGKFSLSRHKDRATVVNLPILTAMDDLAHWAFFMSCPICGTTKLIDAAPVINAIGKDSNNE
tara:strand:+ start:222 stop:521 length:300 start_codon:yes stop_codon:yes gene_type:complete